MAEAYTILNEVATMVETKLPEVNFEEVPEHCKNYVRKRGLGPKNMGGVYYVDIDKIWIPEQSMASTDVSVIHELVHASGHPSRLSRKYLRVNLSISRNGLVSSYVEQLKTGNQHFNFPLDVFEMSRVEESEEIENTYTLLEELVAAGTTLLLVRELRLGEDAELAALKSLLFTNSHYAKDIDRKVYRKELFELFKHIQEAFELLSGKKRSRWYFIMHLADHTFNWNCLWGLGSPAFTCKCAALLPYYFLRSLYFK
jgi:hypothetical protein